MVIPEGPEVSNVFLTILLGVNENGGWGVERHQRGGGLNPPTLDKSSTDQHYFDLPFRLTHKRTTQS